MSLITEVLRYFSRVGCESCGKFVRPFSVSLNRGAVVVLYTEVRHDLKWNFSGKERLCAECFKCTIQHCKCAPGPPG